MGTSRASWLKDCTIARTLGASFSWSVVSVVYVVSVVSVVCVASVVCGELCGVCVVWCVCGECVCVVSVCVGGGGMDIHVASIIRKDKTTHHVYQVLIIRYM